VVSHTVLNSTTQVDVTSLPSGTYMLQINDLNGHILKLEKVQILH
jgi:hypothetical protein